MLGWKVGDILNVGKLRKGGELYYLNSVARGVEDYYTGSGEAPGYWIAKGAAELGLEGEVERELLRSVLSGRSPTGALLIDGKRARSERVPGFDLTFRAPKSVSLVAALGSSEISQEVVGAHESAVAAALSYLERHASGARRGKAGKDTIPSHGFIGAAFRHRTSRAGDPLLHTHVLVANLIKGRDGRWGALDGRQLYRYAKTAGYLYQAHLRYELTRRLGLEWGPVHNGLADIAGVPRNAIEAFSKRRSEIREIVGEVSDASPRSAQIAALASRKAKDYRITPEDLRPLWQEKAKALGLGDEEIRGLLGRSPYRAPMKNERAAITRQLAGPDGLTRQSSAFTARDVIQGICNAFKGGAPVSEIERTAESFLASGDVVPLNPGSQRSERRYSTPEMLSVERAVIEHSLDRRSRRVAVVPDEVLDAVVATRTSLFADQEAMVRRLTTSGDGVEVVVGKAGAGKTFALDAARKAWELSGHRVVGCSLSARAAEELELGSGIRSSTLAALLAELDHPSKGLPRDAVVIVDEAGMVGTRHLRRLLLHAADADAKVVLVGDDKQLPEIESGGAFRGLKIRLPAIELSEVRRQPLGWEREALDLLRAGRAQEAIDSYVGHGRVVAASSAEETRRRLLSDWWATYTRGEPAVMLAARRSDVDDLNDRARILMSAAGRLGVMELSVDGRAFAEGDRVMTLRNTPRLGVKNGTRGTLEHLDPIRGEVSMRRDDGALIVLPHSYLAAGYLTHSYAMTGHKAQGMTTGRAYVLGDQTLYREWAYVAMSRGRDDNRLYVVAGIDHDRQDVGGEVASVTDPMEELVSAVGRSRAKSLALDTFGDPDAASNEVKDGSRLVSEEREAHVREISLGL